MTVGRLRALIREFGVDDTMRHQAGFGDLSGASSGTRDVPSMSAPLGLGSDEQEDETTADEQEKSQPGLRVADRTRRATG